MQGGKSFQDRVRSANVRNMALDLLEEYLSPDYEDKEYQKQVMLRMAPNLLPRLNEHSGPDGAPIPLLNVLSDNNSSKEAGEAEEED